MSTSFGGRVCTLAAGVWLTATLTLGAAAGNQPDQQTLVFNILRNGAPLGTQSFVIRRAEQEIAVELTTDLTYRLMGMTLYQFRQRGREVWRQGRLVALETETDDNGRHHHLQVQADADGRLTIRTDSQSLAAGDHPAPATLWNRDALAASHLIDSIDGTIMSVTVEDLGDEVLAQGGRTDPARHYKIGGGLQREVWFRGDGRLLRVSFTASDGSLVEYRPAQP